MYQFLLTATFKRRRNKLIKNNSRIAKKLEKTLGLLSLDPKHPSLKSHQADTQKYGRQWSSKVTGDIRIIWNYWQEDKATLTLLDIGGHEGKSKVYK